ncbi:MAG: hypothetical protein HKN39_04485 [Flavobacteriales bacterium]|nr:hypothetical protein [Flavobacteriales bacterium]
MNNELIVSKSIKINATEEKVWNVITDPEKIKVYLFGTETITDWNIGSPIVFQGEYEGNTYKDKGNVLRNEAYKVLQYNYWSGFSGLEDREENYSIVTYEIEKTSDNAIRFTWTQVGFSSEQGHQHMENGLPKMLEQIKDLSEK